MSRIDNVLIAKLLLEFCLQSEALHQQLRAMSRETTQEASAVHTKQLQYDRQIADMSLTISKLQAILREAEKEPSGESGVLEPTKGNDDEMANQIKLLSEEVLRLREKVANHNSESLTMKNRLRAAVDRATKADDELAAAVTSTNGNDMYDSMERAGPSSGNGLGRRRRTGAPLPSGSIRSAMRLNPGQGERTEQIGNVVDALDSFAVSTGKYLRRNAVARAGFIVYLLLIHIWTFVLLFFHAHSFETEHGDFGAGIGLPHGPHALMQQQQQLTNLADVGSVEIKPEAAQAPP
jgi:hypothetical protein